MKSRVRQIINTRTDITNGVLHSALKNADGLILSTDYNIDWLVHQVSRNPGRLKMAITSDTLAPLFAKNPICRTLLIDSVSVGKDAANYFNSLGRFASYGFVHGAVRYPWSMEREKGFRSALSHKLPIFTFPHSTLGCAAAPVIAHEKLAPWLNGLPKPAAIFGANDLFAREVLNVCERLGLMVPGQVTVIGCDNDPLIWGNAHPLLSSLQLPFRELGYKAAETLDKLLLGKKNAAAHDPRGRHTFV